MCRHAVMLPCPEIESLLLGACHVCTIFAQQKRKREGSVVGKLQPLAAACRMQMEVLRTAATKEGLGFYQDDSSGADGT